MESAWEHKNAFYKNSQLQILNAKKTIVQIANVRARVCVCVYECMDCVLH